MPAGQRSVGGMAHQDPRPEGPPPGRPTVAEVADRYVDEVAALDPVAATYHGIAGHDDEMTDYGPEGHRARAEAARRARRAVLGAHRASPGDALGAAVMAERLQAEVDVHEAGEWRRTLGVLFGPVPQVRECFDLMPTDTPGDWEAVARRMDLVPAALDGVRATLAAGLAAGTPAARRQALACAAQARAWSAGPEPFFVALAGRFPPGGPAGLGARLETAAQRATAAYAGLARFLAEEYAPRAAPADGVGPERYALWARVWNGTDVDPVETYRWGWDELRRVSAEMDRVAGLILPGATLGEVVALLESDPARAVEGEDRLRAWLQDLMDEAMDGLAGVHVDIPAPLRRLEACLAPPGGAAAQYYTAPSEDFTRPGRTWYPTQGRTRFPLWGEVSTAYHEGVPGHHLQVGLTLHHRESLNRFQRVLGFTSGHGEGWALYAERLMGELGYLSRPDHELGMLAGQALRAGRVVVDIGLHLDLRVPPGAPGEGERWTPERAVAFLATRASQPGAFLASEVDRYLGTPGQAISYKLGERVWLEGREAARARAGAGFDLKAFHDRALALGPMGLDELGRRLAAL